MEENRPNFWADMTITRKVVSRVDNFVQVNIKGPMPWDDIVVHYKQGSANARIIDILEEAMKQLQGEQDATTSQSELAHNGADSPVGAADATAPR